ncbi:hypothetical protein EE612_041624, partial [Oryza sativa]
FSVCSAKYLPYFILFLSCLQVAQHIFGLFYDSASYQILCYLKATNSATARGAGSGSGGGARCVGSGSEGGSGHRRWIRQRHVVRAVDRA